MLVSILKFQNYSCKIFNLGTSGASFPGTWTILYWNLIKRIRNRRTRGGSVSKLMVCDLFQGGCFFLTHSQKISHKHKQGANASFSICAYLNSVSLRALEVNATGCHVVSSVLRRRTAPRPYEEVSALIFMFACIL